MDKQQQKPWIVGSRKDVADFFRVPAGTVASWTQDGMPFQARSYDLAEITQWAINTNRKLGWNIGRTPVQTPKLDDDPLLNGEASEGLERYRMARAQQEEIKLAEKRGEVIMTDAFMDCARLILSPFKRLAETFKRQQNHDAFSMVEEATSEVERGLTQFHAADGD